MQWVRNRWHTADPPRTPPPLCRPRAPQVYPAEAVLTAHARSAARWSVHPAVESLKVREGRGPSLCQRAGGRGGEARRGVPGVAACVRRA